MKTNSMIYICYIKYGGNAACVLAVGDDELSMGFVVGSCRGTGHGEDFKESRGWMLGWFPRNTASQLWVSKQLVGVARAIKFNNTNFYGYIRDLLIKTNSMIYICYI